MSLPVKDTKIDREHPEHEGDEASPQERRTDCFEWHDL
jgi:hypothetical protein